MPAGVMRRQRFMARGAGTEPERHPGHRLAVGIG
jgi:hypothetical protein